MSGEHETEELCIDCGEQEPNGDGRRCNSCERERRIADREGAADAMLQEWKEER